MTPRTHFHSSKLIRCLGELVIVDMADTGNGFAEKLSSWIHFADAITLSALHSDGIPAAARQLQDSGSEMQAVAVTLSTGFDRAQAAMTKSIMQSFAPGTMSGRGRVVRSHMSLPEPPIEVPLNLRTAYAPYRRFYEAHQRDMELSIQPLRTNVREAVAKASPRLGKLAELDAVLEKILREREGRLLSRVPIQLARHFEKLYMEHQQNLAGNAANGSAEDSAENRLADNPAGWTKKDGWLARFCNDMQKLLLAEMEFRLQPAMGLIEALKENTQ